jgi:hypothetical protein
MWKSGIVSRPARAFAQRAPREPMAGKNNNQ